MTNLSRRLNVRYCFIGNRKGTDRFRPRICPFASRPSCGHSRDRLLIAKAVNRLQGSSECRSSSRPFLIEPEEAREDFVVS